MEHLKVADISQAGAYLAAKLAYPDMSEMEKREKAACLIAALQLTSRLPPHCDPEELNPDLQQVLRIGRRPSKERLIQRIQHRLLAAEVAGPLIARGLGLEAPSTAPATFEASIARTLEHMKGQDPDNFRGRVWGRSFCVLHYAYAFAILAKRVEDDGNMPPDGIIGLVSSEVFVRAWVEAAEALMPVIEEIWAKQAANTPLHQLQFSIAA